MEALISNYWWVLVALLCIVLYKYILRFLFGMVIVPEDRIGLITKKFVLFGSDRELPDGRIIAVKGEAGFQGKTLAPGLYFGMWFWQYSVTMEQFTIIPEGKIGLIMAKDGSEIPTGNILGQRVESDNFQDAVKFLDNGGQRGRQTSYITSGSYRINTMLFQVSVTDMIRIQESMVGIVTTLDGLPIEANQIAGKLVDGHNNFQDFDAFIKQGGNRGLQPQVILAGSYNLNPWAIQLEEIPMTEIAIGYVGVVISFIGTDGNDLTGADFKHGNIVGKGSKGVWLEPLGPGKYPINKYIMKVELVPTTNLVLNWASARSEAHNLDKNLSTITVRSKDGFPFNLDVAQIIHVPTTEAPKVIARFGNMVNLVSQVLEPTIGNYFRNSAQGSDVIAFLSTRKERQESAKEHIRKVLDEYNVNAVDTLIGDIVPPESLMKTLTDRKIAEEQKVTYETQKQAQETRQGMEKETAIADMQKDIVKAQQSVEIAERTASATVKKSEGDAAGVKLAVGAEAEATKMRAHAEAEATKARAQADSEAIKLRASAEAEQISLTGSAEAGKILAVGKSTAEAYELAVKALGGENFTRYKITEELSKGNVKLIPDVLIGGNHGGSAMDGLLGLKLMELMDPQARKEVVAVAEIVETKAKPKKDNINP
ncbi:SPFH domain-containing protein [Pedobacter alluvionis]|uniref:Flotillin family protein n=1 Tax=Pedobacter alluvionis TaxID=475253 RepID=A0A497Y3E7_9SPHI|nr:SPFH domain-containing protein [Pedobacter alluvionis]RLJ76760.1 putative membrane protein YqiK [Pedobacter alluvionis]TFB33970.1 flotillin family protein [Pedobacter alluvionis]